MSDRRDVKIMFLGPIEIQGDAQMGFRMLQGSQMTVLKYPNRYHATKARRAMEGPYSLVITKKFLFDCIAQALQEARHEGAAAESSYMNEKMGGTT